MTAAHCHRCGRSLKRASASGLGPVCERAVLGSKQWHQAPKVRARRADDDRQGELFA